MYSSIIVTGSIAHDVIMDFPGQFIDYFQKDKLHQINVSFVVDKLEKQLGGTATNISYNLSLLTKNKVSIVGSVGKDGRDFINFFKKRKISVNKIVLDKKIFTASGQVITDKKDNQIWGFYYGASEKSGKIKINCVSKKDSFIIISANHPKSFLSFQKQAIKQKIDYMYDPGMVLTWIKKDDLCSGVKHCKYLVGNDYEISMVLKMLDYSTNQLVELGINVITTLGEKGVKYQSKEGNYKVEGYKVKNVIDPTGAGDAWRGGFVAGICEGKNIIDSLKLGNALASFAVEHYGTVNHRPTILEINRRVKAI